MRVGGSELEWENDLVQPIGLNCNKFYLSICICVLIYDNQIVHYNACFNLIMHNDNSFENQGSVINRNDIF